MYMRRGDEKERARELLEAALQQFGRLAMNGWILRAEEAMSEL